MSRRKGGGFLTLGYANTAKVMKRIMRVERKSRRRKGRL